MSEVKRVFNSPKEAREQAAEATGFLASIIIKAGDKEYEVPQRGLLDDDQADRMAELELETESWDRDEIDIPEMKDAQGNVIRPARTDRPLKRPYRKNGKLVKPSYAIRVAQALWGEQTYKEYQAAGGRATDVTAALAMLDKRAQEREAADPKSMASDSQD
jgi:hypothetical protein